MTVVVLLFQAMPFFDAQQLQKTVEHEMNLSITKRKRLEPSSQQSAGTRAQV